MIKRLIFKLIMMLVVITGWMVYYNPAIIGQLDTAAIKPETFSTDTIKQAVSKLGDKIKSEAPIPPKSTKVYQWRDASGSLHVSDSPPDGVDHVQVREYKSNVNVMPSVKTAPANDQQPAPAGSTGSSAQTDNKQNAQSGSGSGSGSGAQEGGRLGAYKDLLKKAQQSRDAMNQRTRDLDSTLNQ